MGVVGEVRGWFCGRGAGLVGTARCVDIATTEELQASCWPSVRCFSPAAKYASSAPTSDANGGISLRRVGHHRESNRRL